MLTIGSLLRQKRESLGITVRDVARMTGVSYSLVSKFENAVRTPSSVILHKLQNALKMNDEEFQQVLQIRNQSMTSKIDQKGGVYIQWKIIEVIKEFKSIYPIT